MGIAHMIGLLCLKKHFRVFIDFVSFKIDYDNTNVQKQRIRFEDRNEF